MSMKVDLIKHGEDAELKLNGYIDATNANDVDKILSDVVSQFDNVSCAARAGCWRRRM